MAIKATFSFTLYPHFFPKISSPHC